MADNTVVRKAQRLTKDRAKRLVAAGLHRAVSNHGKDEVALAAGCSERCIEKALSLDTLPSAETLANALTIDETALDEFFGALGFKVIRTQIGHANDLGTIAGLSHAAGSWAERLRDGRRCHVDTQALADTFRPLIAEMQAVVTEADRIRGVA